MRRMQRAEEANVRPLAANSIGILGRSATAPIRHGAWSESPSDALQTIVGG